MSNIKLPTEARLVERHYVQFSEYLLSPYQEGTFNSERRNDYHQHEEKELKGKDRGLF
jgi:hypothetical protein